MDVTIKRMTKENTADAALLEKECFSEPWSQSALDDELEKNSSILLCALDGGKLLGYCGIQTVIDEGYITNVAVFSLYRGQGIAKSLVNELLEECKKSGLAFATLEVRESNIPAINLYSGLGFKEVGKRRGFYSHPKEDALLMTYYFDREVQEN